MPLDCQRAYMHAHCRVCQISGRRAPIPALPTGLHFFTRVVSSTQARARRVHCCCTNSFYAANSLAFGLTMLHRRLSGADQLSYIVFKDNREGMCECCNRLHHKISHFHLPLPMPIHVASVHTLSDNVAYSASPLSMILSKIGSLPD